MFAIEELDVEQNFLLAAKVTRVGCFPFCCSSSAMGIWQWVLEKVSSKNMLGKNTVTVRKRARGESGISTYKQLERRERDGLGARGMK